MTVVILFFARQPFTKAASLKKTSYNADFFVTRVNFKQLL